MNSDLITSKKIIEEEFKRLKYEMSSQSSNTAFQFAIITVLHSSLTQKYFKLSESLESHILKITREGLNYPQIDFSKVTQENLELAKEKRIIAFVAELLSIWRRISLIDFATRQQISAEIDFDELFEINNYK